jgi:hypothetical protein
MINIYIFLIITKLYFRTNSLTKRKMSRLLNSLTKLGIGIAVIGGAANSMLYNGYYFI